MNASGNQWYTWVMLACNIPSMLVTLPLGRLSDKHGRRPLMLWCCGTQLFGSTGMLAVCLFRLDLVWMIPPYVVNGFGGGAYTLQSLLIASLTDGAHADGASGWSVSTDQGATILAAATATD